MLTFNNNNKQIMKSLNISVHGKIFHTSLSAGEEKRKLGDIKLG